ncbi:MAG: hypothetical protein U0S12_12730 [Fimbriimonadales bacterium]
MVIGGLLIASAIVCFILFRPAKVPAAIKLSAIGCVYNRVAKFEKEHGRLPSQVDDPERTEMVAPCKEQFEWARPLYFGWELEPGPEGRLVVWAVGSNGEIVLALSYTHDPVNKDAAGKRP